MNGWMGKIIRVNLTDESIKTEPFDMDEVLLYLGGRGLATKLFMNEVDPAVEPFSPENKLIFMTGPLTGTLAACAGRYEIVTKAPLTGTIGASSTGGHFGPELKFAGYDGIIFEGKAKKPVYLYVQDDRIELRDAGHLWGREVPYATDELVKETDEDAKIACIGPAGEKLVYFATIVHDKYKAAGASGLGAVMGSKNLKAVAVKGTQSIKAAKQKEFLDICLKARKIMRTNPVTGSGLPTYGTQILVDILDKQEPQASRSWQQPFDADTAQMSGEAIVKKNLLKNRGCFDCSIGCGRATKVERLQFTNLGEGPVYETGWSFGQGHGINNLEAIYEANFICYELGMDPVTMGSTIACAMELYDKGYAAKKDFGIPLPFENANAAVMFTKLTANREGFGDRMANGPYKMAESYGHPELSMSKKQEIQASDERVDLEYKTSNHGGYQNIAPKAVDLLEQADPQTAEGNAAKLKNFQDLTALVDSLGICLFTTFAIGLPEIAEMVRTCTGINFTDEEVLRSGERTWNLERIFNLKNEAAMRGNARSTKSYNDLDKTLAKYYALRGWDANGIPTRAKKEELSIEES